MSIKKNIPSLNGLRALCIVMVIGYHMQSHHFIPDYKILRYFGILFFNGPLGVNIFFVISGFLITTLLYKEKLTAGEISLKKFYIRRTIRIFPAYYFLLSFYFILQLYGFLYFDLRSWAVNVAYGRQFFADNHYETAHLWSLSVEELFYLIWPFIYVHFNKYKVGFIVVTIGVITCLRLFSYHYPIPSFSNSIISTGDALLVGCLFAIKHDQILAFVRICENYFILVFLFLILSVYSYSYLFHLNTQSENMSNVYMKLSASCYAFFGNIGLVTNLLIGLVIIFSINLKNSWSDILNLPVMNFIGKMSYSIYLWQQFFTQDTLQFHKISTWLLLCIILSIACFSFFVIEKPFLKFKTKFEA